MLNANVPDKAGDIGKSSGRFGNGTKLSHRQTQLFSHNADWFHQICIVRENCGNIKLSLKSVAYQMAAQIHIAPLLFSLPDLCDIRKWWTENRDYSSPHLRRMHETCPWFGDEETAEMDGNLRHGFERVEINLLTGWGGWINPPRYSGGVVANGLNPILGLEKLL